MVEPLKTAKQLSAEIGQLAHSHDRLWRVTGEDFESAVTDYNWEITGASKNLPVRYGDNAYWFLLTECPRRGWRVEQMELSDDDQ